MSIRSVLCSRYKKRMPGLDAPPFPGDGGRHIYENVSQQAWREWLQLQTMLINERQLNMMDLGARAYLNEQRELFLSGGRHDTAEGYQPPKP